ncbi:uncharacterized protein LOC143207783 [Lasioglossum baleicum]|uniref:uncharacterized protein LOC143207783 n=1 Tax=Lasioglossum baleicum TaxID=434251 RepID=UPI003FCC6C0C
MSKKENDEPRRNILMEINSIDNDTGPASITEQIPEASTIVGYSDSPTMSKDILSQEECFSPTKTHISKKTKYEYVTARDILFHDHHYEDTPRTMKRKLNILRKKLDTTTKENKVLKESIRRLKKKVNSLQDVVEAL